MRPQLQRTTTANINTDENMKVIPALITMLGLAAVPAALAQGCCGGASGTAHAGCSMASMSTTGGHEGHGVMQTGATMNQSPSPAKVFAEPVQSVYDNYITVQSALAGDSLDGVSVAADAMAKAIEGDSTKVLSPKVAQQAQALAKAKDLVSARAAFRNLSESLIQHLSTQKTAAGVYHVAYCPMAKASWVQTGMTVVNPYMGRSMVHCGQLKT